MEPTPLENWIMRRSGIAERNRDLLEQYQLGRIRETVRCAKDKSRFYSEYLKGIKPDEIRTFEDLRNVPFTYPRQIKDNPLEFLCVPQSEIKRIVTLKSSGTSGKDKRIFFTEEDLDLTTEFFEYGMSCLADKTDRVLVLLPGNSYGSIGDLLKKALSAAGTECLVHGVMTDTKKTAQCIVENDITCIVGIPIQILQLCRTEAEAFKRIKKVLLSTDYVPEILIGELTKDYGCQAFTHYGMTEMGYGGGVECEALNGYHMRDADLYFEIIDPVSGKAVPDGQTGEVVFTTLTRKAMPLLRYRTGDIASFSSAPCPCGTFLKTMNRVRGRISNKINIGGNRLICLNEIDEIVLSFREVTDYRAYLSKEGLTIEIAAKNDNAYENLKDGISRNIKEYICDKFKDDVSLNVAVMKKYDADRISNSMVKRKIYDLRNEN